MGATKPRPGRKFAEWVTVAVSVLIVAAVAGFLLYQAWHPPASYVPVDIAPRFDQVGQAGGRYVLPVELTNRGQTMSSLRVEVVSTGRDREPRRDTFEIHYFAQGATATRYVYFEDDPRMLRIDVHVLDYALR
jgi:uncharacterized protein (TIGR02588 family)